MRGPVVVAVDAPRGGVTSREQGPKRCKCGRGGHMRVNKAPHTCTSWSAYAAMFGTSPHTSISQPADLRMYNWQTSALFLQHSAVCCRPKHPADMRLRLCTGGHWSSGGYPPPPCPAPLTAPPPPPRVHHSRPTNATITQLKFFFSTGDFQLISCCSWAK